ncbi:glycoside hydrolase superfamily [Lasiosphaeria miniovina]|uniref:Glycoside hydrolase superfamily n=1 Tax=Lasiosphaeria miniovina TaxID=1954250 RepID=A0AA40AJ85_9PEZI|nr:glycoside hydrolase superfamily [Lasiosphaeria miniovina]KAK0716837.1 glycoside hydrolase superfamily [Lasiosphaeria miniovina]
MLTTCAASPTPYQLLAPLLDTPWTEQIGTAPWLQHPRPQLRRGDDAWQSLNGIWTFQPGLDADTVTGPPAAPLAQEVLVPSCIESGVSGVMASGVTHMWFATAFAVPTAWDALPGGGGDGDGGRRVLLHFDAVDYEATVWVNGDEVGFHRGGYDRFTLDVTDNVVAGGGENELLVFVFDPTDEAPYNIPNGKQTRQPSHIWYTPCSGIWQTVWLESVPSSYIAGLDITAGMDGDVTIAIHSATGTPSTPVEVALHDGGGVVVASHQGVSDEVLAFSVPAPALWTPDSPSLYNIMVTMGDDVVRSYTGFRTVSAASVNGVQRPLLNGEFVFQFGTLDQGFWPDGIYVPPTLNAMVFDLQLLKSLGMNMVRKHIKVEPDLFYEACDRLGLLVVQDMPSMHTSSGAVPDGAQQAEFERQLERLVAQHKSFPSIVTWVIYNEGWGQIRDAYHPEVGITARVREMDPTRLVDATTGWFDHGAGDFSDNHHYAEPQCGTPFYSLPSSPYDSARIGFQGEFGGLGHRPAPQHLWPVQAAIDTIPQTYEVHADLESFNYRSHMLFSQLRDQVALFACSGAVWTQTTDVEGEVNGLVTYDRRFLRVNATQWRADIQALYAAAAERTR